MLMNLFFFICARFCVTVSKKKIVLFWWMAYRMRPLLQAICSNSKVPSKPQTIFGVCVFFIQTKWAKESGRDVRQSTLHSAAEELWSGTGSNEPSRRDGVQLPACNHWEDEVSARDAWLGTSGWQCSEVRRSCRRRLSPYQCVAEWLSG